MDVITKTFDKNKDSKFELKDLDSIFSEDKVKAATKHLFKLNGGEYVLLLVNMRYTLTKLANKEITADEAIKQIIDHHGDKDGTININELKGAYDKLEKAWQMMQTQMYPISVKENAEYQTKKAFLLKLIENFTSLDKSGDNELELYEVEKLDKNMDRHIDGNELDAHKSEPAPEPIKTPIQKLMERINQIKALIMNLLQMRFGGFMNR